MIQKPKEDKTTVPILSNDDLLDIGYREIPHFTVSGSIIYDLGRNRILSAGCVGTPNEMLWICEIDTMDKRKITDLVCLHNYDYDGYLTLSKVKGLINLISNIILA